MMLRRGHADVFVLPACCATCAHRDWEFDDWAEPGGVIHHCLLNVFLPTRKGTCARQTPKVMS